MTLRAGSPDATDTSTTHAATAEYPPELAEASEGSNASRPSPVTSAKEQPLPDVREIETSTPSGPVQGPPSGASPHGLW